MNIELTKEHLTLSIEKLKTWRNEMKSQNKDKSNEFLMLMEVMFECVTYLFIIESICKEGAAYIEKNKEAVAETIRQANEYIQLVESA